MTTIGCIFVVTLLSAIVKSSQHTFDAQNPVNIVKEFNNTYFIATTNRIYHVNSHFNRTLQILNIGPIRDEENKVTIMFVLPDDSKPMLFWCGSAQTGLCHVNSINDLNSGNYLDRKHVTEKLEEWMYRYNATAPQQRKLLSYGVYANIGSITGAKSMLSKRFTTEDKQVFLSSTVYDGRNNLSIPHLGYYSIKQEVNSSNYYIHPTLFSPSNSSYSWLTLYKFLAHRYPIYRVSIFEEGDYVYMVVVQRETISNSSETKFHTRVARFSNDDLRFVSYVEAPIQCSHDDHNYNIAVDASISAASPEIAEKLSINTNEKLLYMLQGKSTDSSRFPRSKSSLICALPLKDLDKHLTKAIRRCDRGQGHLVEWYYGREQPCQAREMLDVLTGVKVKEAIYRLIKAPAFSAHAIRPLKYNASMLYAEVQGETTVGFIGSHDGEIQKINLASGLVYLNLAPNSSGRSPVQSDPLIAGNKLLAIAGSKVTSIPIRSCELYETSVECTSSSDPLICGWCGGEKCSMREQCNSTEWYQHAPPPHVHSITPTNSSVTGGTLLTIKGDYLKDVSANIQSDTRISINGSACKIRFIQSDRVECSMPAVPGPWNGSIVVERRDKIKGEEVIATGHSKQVFNVLEPRFFTVSPAFGPVAGGTNLTLTGENLHIGNIQVVKIGYLTCNITFISPEMLTCVTPPSQSIHQKVDIYFLIDGVRQFQTYFEYRPNPSLRTSYLNLHSISSGGVPVCVDGANFESVHKPSAIFTFPTSQKLSNLSLSQKCSVHSHTHLCCLTPDLTSIFHTASRNRPVRSMMNLKMDGVLLSMATVLYHPQPLIHKVTVSRLSDQVVQITVRGAGFNHLYTDKIKITSSGIACIVINRQPTYITCSLTHPSLRSQGEIYKLSLAYANWNVSLGQAVIKGTSNTQPLGPKQDNSQSGHYMIITSVSAALVALVLLLAVCFVWKWTHRSSVATKTNNSKSMVDMTDNEAYFGISETSSDPAVGQPADLKKIVEEKGALIELSRIRLGGVIGSGCFGKVRKGVMVEKDNPVERPRLPIAVKTMKGQSSKEEMAKFVDEALLMQTFSHRHVLTMYGISFNVYEEPMVVLPFMAKGDLCSYLRDSRNVVSAVEMLTFALDIAMGMEYLEHVLCVHRDLAARNCMLDGNLRVKVADFGLSRDLDTFNNEHYQSTARSAKLPVKWMALESLLERCFSSKSDVWAYGVTLWELFTRGAHPYPSVDNMAIVEHVQSGGRLNKPSACPQRIYDMMLCMWNVQPEERPKFTQIVNELQLYSDSCNYGSSFVDEM